jgi:hypothetical protein
MSALQRFFVFVLSFASRKRVEQRIRDIGTRSGTTLQPALVAGVLCSISLLFASVPAQAQLLAPTTTAVTSNATSVASGSPVTFTATVTSASGTPNGTVVFLVDLLSLGSATLNGSGQATFTTSTLPVGVHTVVAVYAGNLNYLASTSLGYNLNVTPGICTITVTPSVSSLSLGAPVSFSIAASGTGGTPTGNVTVRSGSTSLGTVALDGSGNGTLVVGNLPVGLFTITADYPGDVNSLPCVSPPVVVTVNLGVTVAVVVSSSNPSPFGGAVTFTATVTGLVGTPTGSVNFRDGATTIGSGTLNGGGQATFTTSALAVGTHLMTAVYGGDASYLSSISVPLPQLVTASTASTTLASSNNPSSLGAPVTFTATVSPGATGTVTFRDGGSTIGSATLNGSGQAALTTSALAIGSHSMTAAYSGDANFFASTSPALTQSVVQSASTTALTSSANPSPVGAAVTFTATVTGSGGTPTGSVTFRDGATTLGTSSLNGSGQATFTTSSLAPGSHSITGAYGGDTNFAASTSPALTQNAGLNASTTALATTPNPSATGAPVTLTATVTGSSGTPTGTVTFTDGGTVIGTSALASGVASVTISSLSTGTHSLVASYGGNTSYAPSSSSAVAQSIGTPPDSILLRRLQIAATRIVAQSSGSAISGAVDAAISEGFSEDGQFITASDLGLRINSQGYDAAQRMGYASEAQQRHSSEHLPQVMRSPPSAPPPPNWLVWSDVRHFGWNTNPSKGDLNGSQLNALFGVTLRLRPNLLIGALGGYESFGYTSTSLNGELHGGGWTGGVYLGFKPVTGVRFDAAVAQSGLAYQGRAGTASGEFPGTRTLATTSLTGNFALRPGLDVEPQVRVYAMWEKQDAYTDGLGTKQEENSFMTGRASAGGKLTYRWFATPRVVLAPFAGVYADYNFTSGTEATLPAYAMQGANGRLTAGITATTLNGASLTAMGELGGLGGGNYLSWAMRGRGTVPF